MRSHSSRFSFRFAMFSSIMAKYELAEMHARIFSNDNAYY